MNPMPGPGGAFPTGPIWYPPLASKWIATGLIVFAGSVANRIRPDIRAYITSPIAFFGITVLAFYIFKSGFPPMAFALLFFLLNVWAAQTSMYEGWQNKQDEPLPPETKEGFLNFSNTLDWVSTHKRWWVERVLKERPEAIIEKGVATYPISGFSAQGSTAAGNT
jgi:hypothetical protein